MQGPKVRCCSPASPFWEQTQLDKLFNGWELGDALRICISSTLGLPHAKGPSFESNWVIVPPESPFSRNGRVQRANTVYKSVPPIYTAV